MNPMAGIMLQQGFSAYQGGDQSRAETLFKTVLQLDPRNSDALHLLGLLAADRNAHAQAASLIQQSIEIHPGQAAAHANLASSLRKLKRHEEALLSTANALHLDPRCAEAFNTRGNILRTLGRLEEALTSLDQAIALQADFVEAHDNRGSVLRDMSRLEEALASYSQARACAPHYASASWNESLCRLLMGDFTHGWPLYEAGWQIGLRTPRRQFAQPRWTGTEALSGKTILLHAEQGLGDTLQFSRYAQQLAANGAQVILEVQPELHTLLSGLDDKIITLAHKQPLPEFDVHCPLLSLPLACQTGLDSIPAPTRLRAEPERVRRWQAQIGPAHTARVGLVWSGSQTLENDHNRSIPLAALAPLFDAPLECFSLQKELRSSDAECLAGWPHLKHFGALLHDFSDTAALIQQLDLVITVDTAVAHLAATLGKPTWIILPRVPDWRWLMARDDSPWYPSARLFRQSESGNWAKLIHEQLAPALKTWLSAGQAKSPPPLLIRPDFV
jgi:tetratricopeptide (TPR) repeat protein